MGHHPRFAVRLMLAALAGLALAACTSTTTMKTTNEVTYVQEGATILVIEPDVELSLLTAAGLQEPRADWTAGGRDNVLAAMRARLADEDHVLRDYTLPPGDDKALQLIRLHEAVGNTILAHRVFNQPLPSKKNQFDWTLGPDVAHLAEREEADYALFLFARGSYASAGRQALAIGIAVLGGGYAGTGGQAAFASLVDLTTGDIVWFNVAQTGPGTDMRKPEGADSLVRALLKDNPLDGAETGEDGS